jgi:hypothetical protein
MQVCREREREQGVDSDVKKERNCPQMTMSGSVLRAYLQSPPDNSIQVGACALPLLSLSSPALPICYLQQPAARRPLAQESYTSKQRAQHAPSLQLTATT